MTLEQFEKFVNGSPLLRLIPGWSDEAEIINTEIYICWNEEEDLSFGEYDVLPSGMRMGREVSLEYIFKKHPELFNYFVYHFNEL